MKPVTNDFTATKALAATHIAFRGPCHVGSRLENVALLAKIQVDMYQYFHVSLQTQAPGRKSFPLMLRTKFPALKNVYFRRVRNS